MSLTVRVYHDTDGLAQATLDETYVDAAVGREIPAPKFKNQLTTQTIKDRNDRMKLGLAAIAVSILSLVASMAFGAPAWVNGVGFFCGIAGLYLLTKARKGG